jgi:hydrogenase/urease accessory protein HupE
MRLLRQLAVAALGSVALAHDPGLSSVTVRCAGGGVALHAAFANADAVRLLPELDRDRDGALGAGELAADARALRAFAARWLLDGRGAELTASVLAPNRDLEIDLRWPDARGGTVTAALAGLARHHRCYIAARSDAGVVRDALLTPALPAFALPAMTAADLAATPPSGFQQGLRFLLLGVEHIWTGFDHLCFLLGLLVTGGGLRRAAATITAFSAAHSLTLCAAGLGLCALPAAVVEPAIAASIVFVAVENLLRRPQRRWPLALLFGLVHGFGFAGVLQDLDVGGGAIALPLLTFNLGVEAGQLAVAAPLLPCIWWLQRRGHGPLLLRVTSLAIALAGAWWLLERVGAL